MTESNLYNTFEQDTKSFISQINDSLMKLENNGYSADVINHVFRCIHSIKSEAAYLNFDGISNAAHQMESAIEPLRNVGTEVEVDPALIEFCFSAIDKIEELAAVKLSPENNTAVDETVIDKDTESAELPYSSFEMMLIKDARVRGERLYMLSFGIAEDESMKYPRAYLALSNLEQRMNVIKSTPGIEEIDRHGDGRLNVVLTSMMDEDAVSAEINIDQIVGIEIKELSYQEELKNISAVNTELNNGGESSPERVISVEANDIDAISESVTEIKKRLADISSAFGGSVNEKISYDLAGIETISNSMEKMISNLQTVDFNIHFSGFKRTVRDLASRLGKKVELQFDEKNIRLSRDIAEFLADPMLQIIRNAVVHGIEPASVRVENGKSENGLIRLSAIEEDKSTVIIISDDGCGIDEDAVRAAAGSGEASGEDLLEIISRPGFTSMSESSSFAGRGVGLDLVKNRITEQGARMELTNVAGLGCEFRIII